MKQLIVFSDLDGTLLDGNTYSFEKALPALALLKEKEIPLIFCSSKTRQEMALYRKKLDNHHPFITENGGGIYVPRGYFPFALEVPGFRCEAVNGYLVIRLGAPYEVLRKAVKDLREKGFRIRGFGDMTGREVAKLTGLSMEEAEMAQARDFDETFIFEGSEEDKQRLFAAVTAKGLCYTRGRFFHITGNSDKGKALLILVALYRRTFGDVACVAIGDSVNDLPMLNKVDYPFVVQKPDGSYDPGIDSKNIIRADGIGPDGWKKAVIRSLALNETDHPKGRIPSP